MNKRSSAPARIAAVTALAIATIVVVVAIGAALGGGDSGSGKHGQAAKSGHKANQKQHAPATYEVQSGDTLISIAHHTGVPVREIEELNPQVDPQILIAGETLKLR